MTQGEKAKAYDKVREKIAIRFSSKVADEIFSEFEESEDERIRKAISQCVEDMRGQFEKLYSVHHKDAIAWLEKQAEQYPIFEMKTPEESLGIDSDTYSKIVDECVYGEHKPVEDRYMEGYLNGTNDALKTLKSAAWSEKDEKILSDIIKDLTHPCYEEIPDRIEEEIKWIKSMRNRVVSQPKPTWSEEDEKDFCFCCEAIEMSDYANIDDRARAVSWLELLKYKVVSQKQEWSKEDRETIDYLIDYLESELDSSYTDLDKETFTKEINWLKSLRPQSQWKPSYEQMEYLAKAIVTLGDEGNCKTASILNDLRVELKKLKGE